MVSGSFEVRGEKEITRGMRREARGRGNGGRRLRGEEGNVPYMLSGYERRGEMGLRRGGKGKMARE